MITQQKAEFSGETVRNVAGAFRWLARPMEQPEMLFWDWSANPLLPKFECQVEKLWQ